jgi:predicted nucleic acid-binding protein
MRRVFADSLYWIALSHAGDQWHAAAMKASYALQRAEIVTTQEVLGEVLTALS